MRSSFYTPFYCCWLKKKLYTDVHRFKDLVVGGRRSSHWISCYFKDLFIGSSGTGSAIEFGE